MLSLRGLLVLAALSWVGPELSAAPQLLGSFNPAQGGQLNSIAFDPVGDLIYAHFSLNDSVHVYDRNGVFQGTVAKPSGLGGNDDDMDFADEAININGTVVAANSLLLIENDNNPPRIIGADKDTGTPTATQNFSSSAVGQWVGGAYSHDRDTFFTADWTLDKVQEVNASNGSILNTFSINPSAAAPGFDFFFGDLDVLRADGNLYLASDSQNTIRVLDPTGAFVADINVGALGVFDMSGIAFDDSRGEAWISSTNGRIYHLAGFDGLSQIVPEPSSLVLFAGLGSLLFVVGWRQRRCVSRGS